MLAPPTPGAGRVTSTGLHLPPHCLPDPPSFLPGRSRMKVPSPAGAGVLSPVLSAPWLGHHGHTFQVEGHSQALPARQPWKHTVRPVLQAGRCQLVRFPRPRPPLPSTACLAGHGPAWGGGGQEPPGNQRAEQVAHGWEGATGVRGGALTSLGPFMNDCHRPCPPQVTPRSGSWPGLNPNALPASGEATG